MKSSMPTAALRPSAFGLSGAVVMLLLTAVAVAELPQPRLAAIDPPGATRGGAVEVSFSGSDLSDPTAMIFSHPGIVARPVMAKPTDFDPEPQAIPGKMEVTIADDVPPGRYDVAVVCRHGVSNPRAFVVGRTPEVRKSGPIETPEKPLAVPLGATVNARLDANAADHYAVECTPGQRVDVDVWARRIDSNASAVITVFDPLGQEVDAVTDAADGDPSVTFVAGVAGRHVVRVHDRFAGGGETFFYRLAVSTGPAVVGVFPPAVRGGEPMLLTVTGRGLGGAAIVGGRGLEQKQVQVSPGEVSLNAAMTPTWRILAPRDAVADVVALRGPAFDAATQPLAVMTVDLPLIQESEANDDPAAPQAVTAPVAVAGRFFPRGDRDWFSFAAKAGEEIVVEAFSRRLGYDTDAAVLVESLVADENGKPQPKEVAFADDGPKEFQGAAVDQPSLDPTVTFKAPADGMYRVLVKEQAIDSVADPVSGYVLQIRPPKPDFRLLALIARADRADANKMLVASTSLPPGGTVAIDLLVVRHDGFAGEIVVTAEDLPPGVTAAPTVIAGGARRGLVVLQAADDAQPIEKSIRLLGRAKLGDGEVVRTARPATLQVNVDNQQRQPHLVRCTDAIRLAVSSDTVPVTVRPKEVKPWMTARGGKLAIPIDVLHRAGAKGPLSLVPLAAPPELKLPAELKVPEVKIGEAKPPEGNPPPAGPRISTAEVAVDVDPKLAPGTYSVTLQGVAKLSYVRNPTAVARAKAAAERVAAVAKQRSAAVETAKQPLAAAEKLVADAQAGGGQPTAEMVAARDAARNAVAAAEAAFKLAEEERVRREKTAAEATTANAAADVDVPVMLPPITLVVADAPVELKADPATARVEAGGSGDVPVEIDRRFGFVGPVTFEAVSAAGTGKLAIQAATVPAEATKAALKVTAPADASASTHEVAIKGKVSFFDREVTFERKVSVVVAAKPKEPVPP